MVVEHDDLEGLAEQVLRFEVRTFRREDCDTDIELANAQSPLDLCAWMLLDREPDAGQSLDRVFPFEEAICAFKYMEKGGHVGKIVTHILSHDTMPPNPAFKRDAAKARRPSTLR